MSNRMESFPNPRTPPPILTDVVFGNSADTMRERSVSAVPVAPPPPLNPPVMTLPSAPILNPLPPCALPYAVASAALLNASQGGPGFDVVWARTKVCGLYHHAICPAAGVIGTGTATGITGAI